MASRLRREARLAFETLSIEGGLLSPEWLSRAAQLEAGRQEEEDYRVPKGLSLRDEIGRYWRIAHAHWQEFAAGAEQNRGEERNDSDRRRALTDRFIRSLLRDALGFASLESTASSVIDGRRFPITVAALGGRVPVVVAPAGEGVESASAAFGDGSRKRSAFGLAQEYLNTVDAATWGMVSDGLTLRILRDNSSLTRPAWIQADLGRMFSEQRYADFAALWLLAHESRFGSFPQKVEESTPECILDTWRTAGQSQGTRARNDLRDGFREALLALGQGFLSHPNNVALRVALHTGALSKAAYFQQLLRLVYRLIFLLTVEERRLLHPLDALDDARQLYVDGYGLQRLRDRSLKRKSHDRFGDHWAATTVVFRGLANGEPRLALPALSGIFAPTQCLDLDGAKLENRALLSAVFRLGWLKQSAGLAKVNWRDMGPEELGSVYESLLELQPQITQDGRLFTFAETDEARGNARKMTGSYYTPDSLVQVLLDNALEPVVSDTIAKNPDRPAEAILTLAVVDPACGSGHFLLAAARRLAAHLARAQADSTPSAAEYRRALRQVIGRCIFGVDMNPMAVELCKVSLWMEAVEPGLPLTFLNSHIQNGNALIGTTPELMSKGLPDVAWEPIEGDDRKVASALKKRNKDESAGHRALPFGEAGTAEREARAVAHAVADLEAASDESAAALATKEAGWADVLDSAEYRHQKLAADAWCAAFVWPKQLGEAADAAPTTERWRRIRDGVDQPSATTLTVVRDIATHYRFFHWHLQFPHVVARGGFDVVLGNPPWERVKLQEQEFFASRSEEIAGAVNAAARKKLIAKLAADNPQLGTEWTAASRKAEGESHFIRQSGRYPLCGKGDVNTYAIFAEHNRAALGPHGRAGFIVPSGLVTDDTTKEFFESLVSQRQLARCFHFENEDKVFPEVHHAFRFVLLTLGSAENTDLVFFARDVDDLRQPERHVSLTAADFEALNPNTRTCPTFRSRRDADINLAMYRRAGILWRESDEVHGNPWHVRFMRMFDMSNDSALFKVRAELSVEGATIEGNRVVAGTTTLAPLFEAKMVHHFDHRFGTYEGQTEAQANQGKLPECDDAAHADADRLTQPYYWVPQSEVVERLSGRWDRGWLLGWRDITGTEKQRTVIASLIPRTAVGNKLPLLLPTVESTLTACLYACLCSFSLDYAARQKMGGTTLNYFIAKQLPILAPSTYAQDAPWQRGTTLRDWLLPRVLELTYTSWDLEAFARDVGYDGPPFRWDPKRRFLLRCELDAAFFHLYGLSGPDVDYVMDTFPIVRKNEERVHGEFRTKRVILESYDAMTAAAHGITTYQTRLDPPAADPRVVHPPRWGLAPIPIMPNVVPTMPAGQEAAVLIWAIVHASGGAIRRGDLARAFALRNQPELLARFAPSELAEVVRRWRAVVGAQRPQGMLAGALKELAARGGVEVATDEGGRSVVKLNANTPASDQIGEWYRFEASLAMHVLRAVPMTNVAAVDAVVTGDDRALLAS